MVTLERGSLAGEMAVVVVLEGRGTALSYLSFLFFFTTFLLFFPLCSYLLSPPSFYLPLLSAVRSSLALSFCTVVLSCYPLLLSLHVPSINWCVILVCGFFYSHHFSLDSFPSHRLSVFHCSYFDLKFLFSFFYDRLFW